MRAKVVVLGAGYAGLPAAKRLARQVHAEEVGVTLVNARAEFVERPRLHQLATGQPVAVPQLAAFLAGTAVKLQLGTVTGIDVDGNTVTVQTGRGAQVIGYDTLVYALVYALGSNIDICAVPGVAEHAWSLTDREAAVRLGCRLGELAKVSGSVVVCGGGLTGIETAAELAESYPSLQVQLVTVGTPGGWLSEKAQRYMRSVFGDLRVTVQAHARVTEVREGRLALSSRTVRTEPSHRPPSNSSPAGLASDQPVSQPCAVALDAGVLGAYRVGVGYVGHQRVRGDAAELAGLEVLQGLPQLGPGVHHEGPVGLDRLSDRPAAEDEDLEIGAARVLPVVGEDAEPVAWTEHHELPAAHRPAFSAGPA
jgi:thioredoxin reductase